MSVVSIFLCNLLAKDLAVFSQRTVKDFALEWSITYIMYLWCIFDEFLYLTFRSNWDLMSVMSTGAKDITALGVSLADFLKKVIPHLFSHISISYLKVQ